MNAMGRVRRLRDIIWWVAWIQVVYIILLQAVSLAPFAQPPGLFGAPGGALTLSGALSFGLSLFGPVMTFIGWGVLTALCEIHDLLRGEEEEDLDDDFGEVEDDPAG